MNLNSIKKVLFMLMVTALTLGGCFNLKIPNKIIKTTDGNVIKKANTLFPIESFVIMSQEFVIVAPCFEDGCEPVVLNRFESAGSGTIIKNDEGFDYVLTAGHICMPPQNDMATLSFVEADLHYKISLTTGFGQEAIGEIIAIDPQNDLCLLKSSSALGPALRVSKVGPMLHERIHNMANPAGLAVSLAVPVFSGYYVGDVSTLSIFSIPAVGGSSGSPILNENNEIISIVSAAAIRFDEYAIGPHTESVNKFLEAYLP